MSRNNRLHTRAEGFTLVELIVAVAITVTMLAAILSVFLAVMQTVTRGHATQKGFELARGTLTAIERDLNAGFSNRDIGDADKFFGAPMGMMFVTRDVESAQGQPNRLSRVSYVIYLPSQDFVEIERAELDPSGEVLGGGEFIDVATYSLLRFVEPGVSGVDSYPFDWVEYINQRSTERVEWQNVNAELTFAMGIGSTGGNFNFANVFTQARINGTGDLPVGVTKDVLANVRAKKRELWVRMLAGDPTLPNAWDIMDEIERQRIFESGAIPPPVDQPVVDWRDYVVAENVAYQPPPGGVGIPVVDPTNPMTLSPAFFTYGAVVPYVKESEPLQPRIPIYIPLPYWNSVYNTNAQLQLAMMPQQFILTQFDQQNATPADPGLVFGTLAQEVQLGSPLKPRMPELIGVRMGYQLESPFVGVPEFQKVFGQIIDLPTAYTRKQMNVTGS